MRKPLTVTKLKKKLDVLFSRYIRQKHADRDGYAYCFTCLLRKPWSELQCGHFVSRSHLATRFDEDNCKPQCVGCNVFGGGKHEIFALKLESISKGLPMRLYRKSQEITKDFPYLAKIEHYQSLLKDYSK